MVSEAIKWGDETLWIAILVIQPSQQTGNWVSYKQKSTVTKFFTVNSGAAKIALDIQYVSRIDNRRGRDNTSLRRRGIMIFVFYYNRFGLISMMALI
jgi:hypothetical protein